MVNPEGELKMETNGTRGRMTRTLMILLAVIALVAAACTGESTTVDTAAEESTTVDTAENTADDPAESDDSGASDSEPAGEETEEDPDDAESTDPGTAEDSDDSNADDQDADTAEQPPAEDAGVFIEDPFGGIFADFQASFDRGTDPFSSVDALCAEHPAADGRIDSMPGITADTISVHHARNKLEDAAAIGFGIEVGDTAGMFQALIEEINACGGIRGRQLVLTESSFSPLGDTLAETTASCLAATEDENAVVTMNSSGLQGAALLCWTEEHESVLITTQTVPDEFVVRSDGRLINIVLTGERSARTLVSVADEAGELEGRTIGVVWPDTPGLPEQAQAGILDSLAGLGYEVAVAQEIGCGGGSSCSDGIPEAVGEMASAGVDAVFAPLNILSLPGLVSEMVTQGFAPGDVTFFQSNLNSQEGDLVSSKVAAFGGADAAALYNDAFIVTSSFTSLWQDDDGFLPRFNETCLEVYEARSGVSHDYFTADGNTAAGMVATVCTEVRLMARLLYHAGANPTPESIVESIANIGPVDLNNMVPGAVYGTGGTPLAVQIQRFSYPCALPEAFDDNDTCMISSGEFFPVAE